MKHYWLLLLLLLMACVPVGSDALSASELPDPHFFSLTIEELPDVGVPWEQTFDQYSENGKFKWVYSAFEAKQSLEPGNIFKPLLTINNDVVIYTDDVSSGELPQPPLTIGENENISWQSAIYLHPVGDKSAAWQTFLGDSQVPVWWLEFYKDHAYVRISLFGFPLDEAPILGNTLAKLLVSRLPGSVAEIRQFAKKQPALPITTSTPIIFPSGSAEAAIVPPTTLAPTPTRIEPTATQEPPSASGVLAFMSSLTEQKDRRVISGQNLGHGIFVVDGYTRYVNALESAIGSTVGMIGVDYGWNTLHSDQIRAANQVIIEHWNRGGLVTISTHMGNPFYPGSSVDYNRGGNPADLFTPGTPANATLIAQFDVIADGLAELEDAGVIVLWRPFHEMNGDWFWWSTLKSGDESRTSREDFTSLWRYMHDYFTKEKKLNNLLWVYSPIAQHTLNILPTDLYYPGADYVDIVGYTFYNDEFNTETMDINGSYSRLIALGKPFGITETGPRLRDGSFDTAQVIQGIRDATPMATFFSFWHSWTSDGQLRHVAIVDNQNAQGLLKDPWVLVLGDLAIFP